jgi:putative transcriptional regulator
MQIDIKKLMDEKGITRYELAKRIGVTYPTITSLYNGAGTSIKLDILENLCIELECTPNDIIVSDNQIFKNRLLAYNSTLSKIQNKD